MGFLKALALFVSNYMVDPSGTIFALKSVGKVTLTIPGKESVEAKPVDLQSSYVHKNPKPLTEPPIRAVEKESLPKSKLDDIKKMFKTYKNHPNKDQLGLGVTYYTKGSAKPIEKTLKGVKDIEKFIKEADDKEYRVI